MTSKQKPTGLDFLPGEPTGKRIVEAASEIIDARNPIEFCEAIRAMANVLAHFGIKAEA